MEGITGEALVEAVKQHGQREVHFVPEVADLPGSLMKMIRPDDLVLTLGAGNIVRAGEELLTLLRTDSPG